MHTVSASPATTTESALTVEMVCAVCDGSVHIADKAGAGRYHCVITAVSCIAWLLCCIVVHCMIAVVHCGALVAWLLWLVAGCCGALQAPTKVKVSNSKQYDSYVLS